MAAFFESVFTLFQTFQHDWWWILLVLVAVFGGYWPIVLIITVLLFWRAGDIFAGQHLLHCIHRNRV